MRILILTDSLSLPRKYNKGEVLWQQIYPNLLKEKFKDIEFIHVGLGGFTIEDLYLQTNYYSNLNPNILILQSGIVDCAPRSLGRIELEIVKKLRIFRLVKPFFKVFRKYRGISYTDSKKFETFIEAFKLRFVNSQIWSIGILPGCEEYDLLVPKVSLQIKKYNTILKEHTNFISLDDIPRICIIEDYHHMNVLGHQFVFEKLSHKIKNLIQKN